MYELELNFIQLLKNLFPEKIMNVAKLIHLSIQYNTGFNRAVFLVGKNKELGSWDVSQAKRLTWSKDDHWFLDIEIIEEYIEYKYFIASYDCSLQNQIWETGQNRYAKISQEGEGKVIKNKFFFFQKVLLDIWNHRKIIFEHISSKGPSFLQGQGSAEALGNFSKKIKMEIRENIYQVEILVDVNEDQQIYYQFVTTINQKEETSPLFFMTINNFPKSNLFLYFSISIQINTNRILLSVLMTIMFIIHQKYMNLIQTLLMVIYSSFNPLGRIPKFQNDYKVISNLKINTVIEFKQKEDEQIILVSRKVFGINYIEVNFCFLKKSNFKILKSLKSLLTLLIQQHQVIIKNKNYKQKLYLCNNSLNHLWRYLQLYKSLKNEKCDKPEKIQQSKRIMVA